MEDLIYKDGHFYDKYGNWIANRVLGYHVKEIIYDEVDYYE
jgi:hypothetical protein